MDWNDLLHKCWWTAVSAVFGVTTVALTKVSWSLAPLAVTAFNALTVWARQKVAAKSP